MTGLMHASALAILFLSITSASAKPPKKFWFSFGDSYSQTWFNVTGVQPNYANPLGNPGFPGWTACAGPVNNWVTQTTAQLNSSFVYVYNHAYGGAVIDDALVTPWKPGLKHLYAQVDDFLNYDAPGKSFYPGWKGDNSIFAFWIGINDIGNSYYLDKEGDANHTIFNQKLVDRYFEIVDKTVTAGARNFIFLSVPPIERSPLMLTIADDAAHAREKQIRQDYNARVKAAAKQLSKKKKGVTTWFYDTEPVYNFVLDHPRLFGITNSTAYGDGAQYAWCNDYHSSPTMNLQVAKGVAAILRPRFI
ncbi:SubName: Full=Uncharacterized protein {ECO:0000313/EMBL:CCA72470.1} [Serendipita indica DSM 11827]|uniref:Carbohydrate esterase family 16 protein n=1 Tax=Serendipita indica (strain DSM 11827) TaxID=1109443 RepID=G4TMC8_SERID|nr:SubName: Full=Uncharacterized protein {ECO:0000313/EMBL:CCA72470.1} [Serendipita indica DSM 11827]CCA72470.1 hypothetical protein PIIN_06405 [Serendipita indica DSM 11827]